MKNSDLPGLDHTLIHLAVIKTDLGHYTEARQILQEALVMQPHPDGSDAPTDTTATILGNLGALGLANGDWVDARQYFVRALNIRRRLGTDETGDGLVCRFHLATCLSLLGDKADAMHLLDQIQPLLRTYLGDDDALSPLHYQMAGTVLMDMGSFEEAAVYHEEGLRRVLKEWGEKGPKTAKILHSMGQLRQLQGLYTEAHSFFDRALAVWLKIGGSEHEIAVTINALGQLHEALGHHTVALRHYEDALARRRATFDPGHWQIAESLNNIAGALSALQRLDEATKAYQESLTIREKASSSADHPRTATIYAGLGHIFLKQGRLQEALKFHVKALNLHHQSNKTTDLTLGLAEKNVGQTLLKLENVSEAVPHLERAVTLLKSIYGSAHRHTEDALFSLALAQAMSGCDQGAFDLAVEACTVNSRRLGQSFGLSSEKQRDEQLLDAHVILRFMVQLAVQIQEHAGTSVPAVEQAAFQQVLRLKAMRAEVLVLQMESIASGRPELVSQLQALAAVRNQMAQLAVSASTGQHREQAACSSSTFAQLALQREEIEAHLAARIPELAVLRRLQACDLASVAAALPPGSALIEYLRSPCWNVQARLDSQPTQDRYLAFVLSTECPALARMINLGDAAQIDDLVSRCRRLFARRPEERPCDTPDPRPQLREAVFDPLLSALGGQTRLLVAPDVGLALFPLEALPSAAGRVLRDDYQISYLACGRDLLRFQATRPSEPGGSPIIIAAPDFDLQIDRQASCPVGALNGNWTDDERGRNWFFEPLPGTYAEGKAISELLNVQPWIGPEALKERLKCQRSPRVLHLATHGMHIPHPRAVKTGPLRLEVISLPTQRQDDVPYLENALYRSALALAGVNTWLRHQPTSTSAGNGLLTAEEVCSLNLLQTDLVVLSACESGIGDLQMGEGVLGLRWAFTVAGARALVASLWRVDDDATCTLMIELYRQLRDGQSVHAALCAAQKSLPRQWQDPYFWGAFICQGDPNIVPRLAAN